MPRFVFLLHDCPSGFPRPTHCDLMLESGDVLRTWSLATLPSSWERLQGVALAESNSVEAEQLADHRQDYLDYEGPVSGDRGSVKRLDVGTYATRLQTPDRWVIDIAGQIIVGEIELERTTPESPQWQLTFRPPFTA